MKMIQTVQTRQQHVIIDQHEATSFKFQLCISQHGVGSRAASCCVEDSLAHVLVSGGCWRGPKLVRLFTCVVAHCI